jgi:methylated-DNA-protein-cysteine methyltransferase-like protein
MSIIKECMITVVQAIPKGKVASYAQVAELVQATCTKRVTAQVIGWLLSGMPKSERSRLPWWRVVNKQGFISTLKLWDKWWEQERLLREEGVQVIKGCILMSVFGVSSEDIKSNLAEMSTETDALPQASDV